MDFLIDDEIVVDYIKNDIVLFNNDCRKVLEKVQNKSIDLFVSDIPYKISRKGIAKKKENKKYMGGMFDTYNNSNKTIENIKKGKIFENNNINIDDYIGEIYRILKDKSHCYLFSNWSNINEIITKTEQAGLKLQNVLVWAKDNKVCNKYYMRTM